MTWNEKRSKSYPDKTKTVYCPVCKTRLGFKKAYEIKAFECDDCYTEYTFYPNIHKPSSNVHRLDKTCMCSSCQSASFRETESETKKNTDEDYYY